MPQFGEVRREQTVRDGLAVDEHTVIVEDHQVIAHDIDPKRRKPPYPKIRGFSQKLFGGVLLSHRVPPAVPSAL
ncbi:hypothetical protein GCM10010103_29170 [Streptomyces paradoxus]